MTHQNDTTRPANPAAHLTPAAMATAQRHLVAKAIAEFTHERLLAPEPAESAGPADDVGPATSARSYRLALDGGRVEYRFDADRFELEHWVLDEPTLERRVDGTPTPLDAQAFVIELQPLLGIPDALLATYLEEIASTLASSAFKLTQGGPTAAELARADFQTIESAMTEGHPGFVANNGRIGFGVTEYSAFAPEAGEPFKLVWLAARREFTHFALGEGLEAQSFLREQLGRPQLDVFEARLVDAGLDPADYLLLPVHPWQWEHRVSITFAPDLAKQNLVFLGEGFDRYLAQQSLRTMFNADDWSRDYVKTALSIQNMGFLRGLSPAYMRVTPAINDWVAELVGADETLGEAGFRVLREHASIGYTGDAYHRTRTVSPHRKMLAALWRESPVPLLAPNQRLSTMAALLHRDASGASVASALVAASALPAVEWVRAYLRAYLRPLVHCLRAYDLAFMPHGENLILILEDAVPVGVFMKDIGEEVALLSAPRADAAGRTPAMPPVPEDVQRIIAEVDDTEKALAIFTDVFDGVLRHLAGILHRDGTLDEQTFWALVAECVDEHEVSHPHLESGIDLRAETFAHSCLNRLQLRNTLQMVDIANQSESLIYAGRMVNPIARSRRFGADAAASVTSDAAV
ncbi:Siderophore synthetase component [Agromyces sp. CF514]|uniref:IucA/IucC family protein n=1 Tax=Agromyces sp. CF514 TaxID=1881031 RepID=UPI0008F2F427|nr:IucA/IucC family protein [Agromyces sp. CF514]SFR67707.1 Siderophore synthetase component [Agromyces sp. CF514]